MKRISGTQIVINFIGSHPGCTFSEIRTGTGLHSSVVNSAIWATFNDGRVLRAGERKGYGNYEDGILWVGELSNNGEMKYGLNIANANYPEEGSITVFEFDEPLREGADK
ncbi:hypothetical protein [Klebsiella oxytoca]|uniref:Uncharacterized protein n=1 Tax=Klebsiella oxytoca TaxID=571 RepID=A0A6N3GFC8_KLEOX|nr:hypothetical protein [Klebsiella oxytoca]CAG0332376.1 hypothetical protein AN2363V1_3835 [Klebsiella oxytoca]CAH6170672.1 hypothetical protein AN2363V1_3835 [Klebsiella oxytoca]